MVTAVMVLLLAVGPASAMRKHEAAGARDRGQGGLLKPHGSVAVAKVPLPRPRPAEAPKEAFGDGSKAARQASENPTARERETPAAPAAPQPSACRQALTEEVAIAPSSPDIRGPGGCGGDDLVRLEAIVLPDEHRVAVNPPATLRCSMATAVADWVRSDVVAITRTLGSEPSGLDSLDSYDCRTFNGITGAHLSEHGRADALDVRAIRLADGRSITLTDRNQPRGLRESLLHSVCARFTTVLGPDSDGYHEEHIHLDLMERHNNYRICEWDVLDPLPKIAPLLPAARPEEAPPREIAKEDKANAKDKADDAAPHATAK